MQNGICPLCGAAEVYRKESAIGAGNGWLLVKPWRLFGPKIFLDALICGACGHVALQVPPRQLGEMRTTFKEDAWKHVKPTKE